MPASGPRTTRAVPVEPGKIEEYVLRLCPFAATFAPDHLAATAITGVLAKAPALERAGIGWDRVGAVGLDEAFAVQSLTRVDAWRIDPEIVNVKGGAIAIGRPLGASGARILGTLARVLVARGERYGVAAICIGVGQALAVVLENVTGGAA